MITGNQTATQVDRLPNANQPVGINQDVALPVAKAWRIGGDRIAWRCPNCKGLHLSGEPEPDDARPTRYGLCMAAFAAEDVSPEFVLDIRPGRAPQNVQLAIAKGYPLGDLAVAYHEISHGRAISRAKLAKHDPADEVERFWVPSKQQILFAFGALARCGAMDEALALRAELGELTGRKLWRAAASDFWRRRPGRSWKNRLLNALRQAWLQHGGAL